MMLVEMMLSLVLETVGNGLLLARVNIGNLLLLVGLAIVFGRV